MTAVRRSILSLLVSVSYFSHPLYAKEAVDIAKIMKQSCPDAIGVEKRSRLLSKKEAADIQKVAGTKLRSRIVRYYTASGRSGPECLGILLSRKVRTKKAAVLYIVKEPGKIVSIEILAFAEPPEYKPAKSWLKLMDGKDLSRPLRAGRDIPAISGATLSARNVTDGARLALALFDILKRGR